MGRKPGGINKKYSSEFKISVILDMREHHLGYRETVQKYDLKQYSTIKRWERIFIEEGKQGLMEEKRGRSKNGTAKRGRPPKLKFTIEKDLIEENQELRMEIEYLKKLSALVLAEEQKSGEKRK